MSDEHENDEERDRDEQARGLGGRVLSASPLIWVLLAAALGWAVWATVSGGGGQRVPARLVVIPTAQSEQTVVALPCASGAATGGDAGTTPPGAITAVVPAGGGDRLIAVTGCRSSRSGAGSLTGGAGGRTAMVLLPPGTQAPSGSAKQQRNRAAKLVPGMRIVSSTRLQPPVDAKSVVVPACPPPAATSGTLPSGTAKPSGGGIVLVGCPAGS